MYKITIKVLGEEFKSSGETLLEALEGFKIEWQEIKGGGELTVVNGKRKCEIICSMIFLRRILHNKIIKIVQAKRLELLLDRESLLK